MRFSAPIGEFQKVLQKVFPAIPTKATIEVLEYYNLILEDNILKIIGTDQDLIIMAKIQVTDHESGRILVPAKKLNEIIKELGNTGILEFITDIENYNIEIRTQNGQFDMKGLDPEEYLTLPQLFENDSKLAIDDGLAVAETPAITFFDNQLSWLCDKSYHSISRDEYRPQMNGMLLQFNGNSINSVSTDSFRLTKTVIKSERSVYPEDIKILIPLKTVEYLKKITSSVNLTFIKRDDKISHLKFIYDNIIFITNVINEKFPPYETVIPENNNIELKVNKNNFISAIRRSALFADDKTKQLKISFKHKLLEIQAIDESRGTKAFETLPCDANHEPYEIGFNGKYLLDALSNLEDNENSETIVRLTFGEPEKPVLMFNADDIDGKLLMLLMPIRIS